ncbi:MAG TPA: Ig-like domain repeat protein [Acidobacteriaceae bacterium]|nr:Ig-like domain repeat protein [Acidobacteriaceae bacterium]
MSSAQAQTASSPLLRPAGIAYDSAGDLFIADSARNQVFEISIGGAITAVAGNGTQGFSGDGGPASAAELNSPSSVAIGADGTLYIADTGNQRIRAVKSGSITTFGGNGARGYSGDGSLATSASLNHPVALAIDATGALLVCDQGNDRVRRISAGQIATIAGNGTQGFAGDGGAATAAELNEPSGIVATSDGRVFIADSANQRVRVISAAGIISTYAGTGVGGNSGDSGPATAAQLNRPTGLAIDSANDLFIADENNHRLRRIAAGGTITTVAGGGLQGLAPDGSIALTSPQNLPAGAAVSNFGWPVIADAANHSVQIVFSDGKLYSLGAPSGRTTTLAQSTPNAVYGTAQAVITAAGSPALPQGSVQILDGVTPVATAALAQGSATVALPTLSAGSHNLTALYGGDGLHLSSTATSSIVISPAPVTATAVAATASYGAPLPAFNGTLVGVLPQDESNVSVVFTAASSGMPTVGTYPITAKLTGAVSSNYTLSIAPSSGTLTIVPAATKLIFAPPSTAYASLPIQLNAQVASTTSGTPTGTVEFLDGSNVVGTAVLINGSASVVELNPATGNHTLSVSYSGDANFRASTSATVNEAVNAMPDFTIGVTGNTQQTAIAGSSASFALSVASQGSPFTGAVTFSATGLPAGATISFSPPAVVPGASTAPVTMTIVAPATTAHRAIPRPDFAFASSLAICLLALRRRRTLPLLLVLIVAAGLFGVTGCGARTAPESVLPVTNYAIVVQATGTNLAGNVVVHTTNVTLAVE